MNYICTQRTCIKCGELKELNKENYQWHSNHKCFTRKCLKCVNEDRKTKYPNTKKRLQERIVEHPENRVCSSCNNEKPICKFSYKPSVNSYSYICKYCDTQEKRFQWQSFSDDEKRRLTSRKKTKYKPTNLIRGYIKTDKKKGLETSLTKDFVINSLKQPCSYCGFNSDGLDRVDNSIGHIESNCIPCCTICNTARMDNFTHQEMLLLGQTIKEIKESRIDSEKFLEAVKLILNN